MSVSVHILLRHQGVLGASCKSRWGLLLGFSVAKGVVMMVQTVLGGGDGSSLASNPKKDKMAGWCAQYPQ